MNFATLYATDGMADYRSEQIAKMVMADSNVAYITDMIISKQDPTRSGPSKGSRNIISDKVSTRLQAWARLDKFKQSTTSINGKIVNVLSMSPIAILDSYNMEFVEAFADVILPANDITNVSSVVNPNGMYAHQERIIKMHSKPVPFYQRAVFKRLNDWTVDARVDETEAPFYRMDNNPRISANERKKTEVSRTEQPSYLDRTGLSYRMIPKY
jgi:hypothetical protein